MTQLVDAESMVHFRQLESHRKGVLWLYRGILRLSRKHNMGNVERAAVKRFHKYKPDMGAMSVFEKLTLGNKVYEDLKSGKSETLILQELGKVFAMGKYNAAMKIGSIIDNPHNVPRDELEKQGLKQQQLEFKLIQRYKSEPQLTDLQRIRKGNFVRDLKRYHRVKLEIEKGPYQMKIWEVLLGSWFAVRALKGPWKFSFRVGAIIRRIKKLNQQFTDAHVVAKDLAELAKMEALWEARLEKMDEAQRKQNLNGWKWWTTFEPRRLRGKLTAYENSCKAASKGLTKKKNKLQKRLDKNYEEKRQRFERLETYLTEAKLLEVGGEVGEESLGEVLKKFGFERKS